MSAKIITAKTYWIVWAILLVGFLLNLGLAHVHMAGFNIVVALGIGIGQALLVIIYFMHARYSSRLTWVFVVAGFYWLGILFVLGFGDYLSRDWIR